MSLNLLFNAAYFVVFQKKHSTALKLMKFDGGVTKFKPSNFNEFFRFYVNSLVILNNRCHHGDATTVRAATAMTLSGANPTSIALCSTDETVD